jgi:hypothetical protein
VGEHAGLERLTAVVGLVAVMEVGRRVKREDEAEKREARVLKFEQLEDVVQLRKEKG